MKALPSNVTYRQFDHWCTKGYIKGGKEPGTGNYRDLGDQEWRVLGEMGRLVESGLTPLLPQPLLVIFSTTTTHDFPADT